MTITPQAARIIGKEIGKVMLAANAKSLRLEMAATLYGPSESTLYQAITLGEGKGRLRAQRRKLKGATRAMILIRRDEMERWIDDNFEEIPEKSSPVENTTEEPGKHEGEYPPRDSNRPKGRRGVNP